MDPELQKKVTEILDYLLQTTKASVDFAAEQLPLIAWEQVAFARVWYTLLTALAVAAVVWLLKPGLRGIKQLYKRDPDGMLSFLATIGYVVAWVFVVPVGFTVMRTAVLAWAAPRVYLLEWAVGLVRRAQGGS